MDFLIPKISQNLKLEKIKQVRICIGEGEGDEESRIDLVGHVLRPEVPGASLLPER